MPVTATGDVCSGAFQRTFRHGAGNLFADRSVHAEHVCGNTQDILLGFVRVGDEAVADNVG